jgi:hypothetical protein
MRRGRRRSGRIGYGRSMFIRHRLSFAKEGHSRLFNPIIQHLTPGLRIFPGGVSSGPKRAGGQASSAAVVVVVITADAVWPKEEERLRRLFWGSAVGGDCRGGGVAAALAIAILAALSLVSHGPPLNDEDHLASSLAA